MILLLSIVLVCFGITRNKIIDNYSDNELIKFCKKNKNHDEYHVYDDFSYKSSKSGFFRNMCDGKNCRKITKYSTFRCKNNGNKCLFHECMTSDVSMDNMDNGGSIVGFATNDGFLRIYPGRFFLDYDRYRFPQYFTKEWFNKKYTNFTIWVNESTMSQYCVGVDECEVYQGSHNNGKKKCYTPLHEGVPGCKKYKRASMTKYIKDVASCDEYVESWTNGNFWGVDLKVNTLTYVERLYTHKGKFIGVLFYDKDPVNISNIPNITNHIQDVLIDIIDNHNNTNITDFYVNSTEITYNSTLGDLPIMFYDSLCAPQYPTENNNLMLIITITLSTFVIYVMVTIVSIIVIVSSYVIIRNRYELLRFQTKKIDNSEYTVDNMY